MKIGICNDHVAYELKCEVVKHLESLGHEVINYGTNSTERFDYPLAAKALCQGYKNKEFELGIAICGTGVGISIACNKHKGIRACCCSEAYSARLTREHNDANVICFGSRVIAAPVAFDIVDAFISTAFSNVDRHINRINQIKAIEDEQ